VYFSFIVVSQNFIGFLNIKAYQKKLHALFGQKREIALCDESSEARTGLLEKPEGEPSQVLDFNLGTLQKILGSVLYQYDPAERGNREAR